MWSYQSRWRLIPQPHFYFFSHLTLLNQEGKSFHVYIWNLHMTSLCSETVKSSSPGARCSWKQDPVQDQNRNCLEEADGHLLWAKQSWLRGVWATSMFLSLSFSLNILDTSESELPSCPFRIFEQSELVACLALGLSIFAGLVPFPLHSSFLTIVIVTC